MTSNSPIVIVAFQTGARANGGLESLMRIVEALPRRVMVVTDMEGDVAERSRSAGASVRVWKVRSIDIEASGAIERMGGRLARVPALAWFNERVRRLMHACGSRVLMANDIRAFWHAAPGAKSAGARVVFVIRDMFLPGRAYGPKWRLTRHVADTIIALSDSMRRETIARITPYFSERTNVERIYSIVDGASPCVPSDTDRTAARQALNVPFAGPLFVVAASFCDKKNQLDLLRHGASALFRLRPDATLAFAGDFDPDRSEYSRKCREVAAALHHPDRVRFLGFTSQVRLAYRAATATCVASRYEGMARSMIESLAEGTPVVSFDVTSAREILVEHGAGMVRRQGDYLGLAEDLALVATDDALRLRMATAGLVAARGLFSAHAAAREYERVLSSLEGRRDVWTERR